MNRTKTLSRTPRVLALALLSGCAALAYTHDAEPLAVVIIENDSTLTVNAFAVRHNTRLRLGTIPGLSSMEFPLRHDHLGPGNELEVLIDPIGSARSYRSDRIVVGRGDTIALRVSGLIR